MFRARGSPQRINESPWARCLQGAVDTRWVGVVVGVVVGAVVVVVGVVVVECYCFLIHILLLTPPKP